jgi:hypothetical protein
MIVVAALNLLDVRMHSPPYARHLGQVILGSAVSLYFTPTGVGALATNFPAIFAGRFGRDDDNCGRCKSAFRWSLPFICFDW